MKTLQEYILEAMSQEQFLNNVRSMFGINDDDYESAYNVLKSANSTKGLLDGVENYIKDENEIKTPGYYLCMLFELSGLKAKDNEHVIKSIIKDNNVEELNAMLDILIKYDKKNSLIFDFNENKNRNLLEIFCKNFENLAKYIFKIKDFKKSENTAAIGPGELLLQLLIGGKETTVSGDVVLPDGKILEVKGKNGKLGSSKINSTETTELFITKLKAAEIVSKDITPDGSCFGGTHSIKNGVKIFNNFWENITLSENAKIDDIFKCYIETIFNKYGFNKDVETIFNALENPFKIVKNKLSINISKISNTDFIQLTGFLYLYAYQQSTGFNYLIVFDDDLNFKCLKCKNSSENISEIYISEIYKEIKTKFSFILPGNTDDKSNRSNVAVINLKK